jgi:signal transduction histidine kinase
VADTGVGIDPTMRDAVFDPGRQLDPTRDGLGLGRAIARRTAAVLGHTVHVASEPGRGSRFSVVLPLASRFGDAI